MLRRPDVAKDLAAIAIEDAYDLLDCHVADEASIRKLVEGDPINTDDRPLLEFSCAVRLPWEQCLRGVLRMIRLCRVPIEPRLRGFADEAAEKAELARRFEATNLIFEAQFAQLAGLPVARRQKLDLALKTNPGEAHVRTCEEELSREIVDLQKAFQGSPGSEAYAYRLADKLFAAQRMKEAAALYEPIAARTPPPAPLVFLRLAEIHFGEGKMAEAERTLLRCLELWPGSADAHDRLGGLYLRLGRKDDALRHIQQALALQPDNELFKVHRDAILGQR